MGSSPARGESLEGGAQLARRGRAEIVEDFGDPRAEYAAVRERVGLADRSARGRLLVTGPDARAWLQGLVTNDVRLLGARQPALPACILTPTGQVVTDLILVVTAEGVLLDLPRPALERAMVMLDGYLIAENARMEDRSDVTACLSLQGPGSGAALAAITLPAGAVAVPVDHTGHGGFDLYLAVADAAAAWRAARAAGARPVGEAALDVLRIEAGIPRLGAEIGERTLPAEAALDRTHVSDTKGCYVGQEVVARIRSRGHANRALRGLLLEGPDVPAPGDVLLAEGDDRREVGRVTSAAWSPALAAPIALGYVRREACEVGTLLRADRDGGAVGARVVALPFEGAGARPSAAPAA